jgi:hypothetical protein
VGSSSSEQPVKATRASMRITSRDQRFNIVALLERTPG